jgi:predicted DsbA family dithiol-disulfide isomerase
MCPWCFIGLVRLQRALATSTRPHRLRFIPYVFDPDTPSPSLPWNDYVSLRYPDRAEAIKRDKLPLTLREAASEGLRFVNYDTRPMGACVDALRLLHVPPETQLRVVRAMLSAHFERGVDIALRPSLLVIAAEAGLSESEAVALLDGEESLHWVLAEDARAKRKLGVTSVPTYFVRRGEGAGEKAMRLVGGMSADEWSARLASLEASKWFSC